MTACLVCPPPKILCERSSGPHRLLGTYAPTHDPAQGIHFDAAGFLGHNVFGRPVVLGFPLCAHVSKAAHLARSWRSVLVAGAPERLHPSEVQQWRQEVSELHSLDMAVGEYYARWAQVDSSSTISSTELLERRLLRREVLHAGWLRRLVAHLHDDISAYARGDKAQLSAQNGGRRVSVTTLAQLSGSLASPRCVAHETLHQRLSVSAEDVEYALWRVVQRVEALPSEANIENVRRALCLVPTSDRCISLSRHLTSCEPMRLRRLAAAAADQATGSTSGTRRPAQKPKEELVDLQADVYSRYDALVAENELSGDFTVLQAERLNDLADKLATLTMTVCTTRLLQPRSPDGQTLQALCMELTDVLRLQYTHDTLTRTHGEHIQETKAMEQRERAVADSLRRCISKLAARQPFAQRAQLPGAPADAATPPDAMAADGLLEHALDMAVGDHGAVALASEAEARAEEARRSVRRLRHHLNEAVSAVQRTARSSRYLDQVAVPAWDTATRIKIGAYLFKLLQQHAHFRLEGDEISRAREVFGQMLCDARRVTGIHDAHLCAEGIWHESSRAGEKQLLDEPHIAASTRNLVKHAAVLDLFQQSKALPEGKTLLHRTGTLGLETPRLALLDAPAGAADLSAEAMRGTLASSGGAPTTVVPFLDKGVTPVCDLGHNDVAGLPTERRGGERGLRLMKWPATLELEECSEPNEVVHHDDAGCEARGVQGGTANWEAAFQVYVQAARPTHDGGTVPQNKRQVYVRANARLYDALVAGDLSALRSRVAASARPMLAPPLAWHKPVAGTLPMGGEYHIDTALVRTNSQRHLAILADLPPGTYQTVLSHDRTNSALPVWRCPPFHHLGKPSGRCWTVWMRLLRHRGALMSACCESSSTSGRHSPRGCRTWPIPQAARRSPSGLISTG